MTEGGRLVATKKPSKKVTKKKVAKKASKKKVAEKNPRQISIDSALPRLGEQFPDPDWAVELLDGKPEKAQKILKAADELGDLWGSEAADDCKQAMGEIFGKAALRKVERENPNWDGITKIIPPKGEIVVATQELIAARRKKKSKRGRRDG